MIGGFISWWLARISELLPSAWTNNASRIRDGIVIDVDHRQNIDATIRRAGQQEAVTLGAAARMAAHKPVLLRPPPQMVLVKRHTIPTAPRRQMEQILRHELARITPFPAPELFWRWDSHAKPGDPSRTDVTLTMVPMMALAPALATLDSMGLKANFVEVGPADRPQLLPIGASADRSAGRLLIKGLACACVGLAIIALMIPLVQQHLALRATEDTIAELKPALSSVEALRRGMAAGNAGRDVLAREMQEVGDPLQILATVTRILPDDTYLTDFSLRARHMTLTGRSASAPRLITGLSADPAIRDTAFAAPVTRIEGATSDLFSIRAEAAR
jgi:general secretion pathway protein L